MNDSLTNIIDGFRGRPVIDKSHTFNSTTTTGAGINEVTTDVSSDWSLVSLCSFQDQQLLDYRFAKSVAEKNALHQETLVALLTDLSEWADDNPDQPLSFLRDIDAELFQRTFNVLGSVSILTEDVNFIDIGYNIQGAFVTEIHFDEVYQPLYRGPTRHVGMLGISVDTLIEAVSVLVMAASDLQIAWSVIANMAGEILNSGNGMMSFENISRGVADSNSPRLKQFYYSLSQFLTVSGEVNSSVIHSIIAAESGIAVAEEGESLVNFSDELPYISNSCGLVLSNVFKTVGAAVIAAVTIISPIVGFVLGALTTVVSSLADVVNSTAANIADAVAEINTDASDYILPQYLCRIVLSTSEIEDLLGPGPRFIPSDTKLLKMMNSIATIIAIRNGDEWVTYMFVNMLYCAPTDRVGATMYHYDVGSTTYVSREVQAINAVWSDSRERTPSSSDWYRDPNKVQYISIGLPESLVSTSNGFYLSNFNFNDASVVSNLRVKLMGSVSALLPLPNSLAEYTSETNADVYSFFTSDSFEDFVQSRSSRIEGGSLVVPTIESDVNSGSFQYRAKVLDGSDPSITTVYSNSDLNLSSAYAYPEDAICAKNAFAEGGSQFIDKIEQTRLAVRAIEQSLAPLLCIFLQSREANDSSETWKHVACTSIINVYDKDYQLSGDDFTSATLESLTHELGVFLYKYRFLSLDIHQDIDPTERLKQIYDHVIPAFRAYFDRVPSGYAREQLTRNFLWRLFGRYYLNGLPDSSMINYTTGGSYQDFLARKASCSWICIADPKRSSSTFFTPPKTTISSVRGAVITLGLIAVVSAVVVATTTVLVKRSMMKWQVKKSKQLQAAYDALTINSSNADFARYAKQLRRSNLIAGVLGLPSFGISGSPILVGSSGSSSDPSNDYGSLLQEILSAIKG